MTVITSFGINLVKVVTLKVYPLLFKMPEKFMIDSLCVYKVLYASEISIFFC